jgi:hypothetical protein
MKRSKVLGLPLETRRELERAYREGQFKLDDLMDWLRERKLDVASDPAKGVSRSGLGRHLAKYKKTFERIQEAQDVAGHCVQQLNENPRGEVGRLLAQMLSALAMDSLNQLGDDGEPIDSKELFFLSTAIKNLAGAEKTSVDRELKIRERIAKELANKKAPALEKVAEAERSGGLAPETADAIRKAIAEVEI